MDLYGALAITPDLRDAMSQAQSALQQREDADLAIAANARNIAAMTAAIPQIDAVASRLHAEAIKIEALSSANSASKVDVSKAVKAADKAALDLTEKKRELERATAARHVLADMARDADSAIAEGKAVFTSALATHREQPLAALEDDLRTACEGRLALTHVIAAARAVDAEFPGGLCTPILDNLKIISPRSYRVSHDEIGRPRVSGPDLLADVAMPVTLPEEAALALREINAVVGALKRHKPFTMPKLPHPEPEVAPRSAAEQLRYDEAAERIRRSEAEYDERERRSKLPQTEEQRRQWTLDVRYPRTPAPRRSANDADMRVDDGGTVSDEYRRIGALPPDSSEYRGR